MKYNDNGEYKDIYVKTFDTLPVGAEVDYDGETVPSGWSEVADPNTYSTDEVRIGTWIDNKPIYRKVYKADNISNSYSLTPPDNVNIYTRLSVMQLDEDASYIPDYYYSSTDYLRIFKTNAGIQIRTSKASNTFTHWVIIEYTKTTD